jgi:hypothetical protein
VSDQVDPVGQVDALDQPEFLDLRRSSAIRRQNTRSGTLKLAIASAQ